MTRSYLESVKKQFEYYKMLGDKTISQIPDSKLFWQQNKESNSIAIIVNHLSGNMLSRWTNFLTSDGEKEWRHRDEEFENNIKTKAELEQKWKDGWDCLFRTLNSLQEHDFSKTIYIRNQGHSVIEAINRQLAHYPYHIGQMVFIGKMICGKNWVSLSIPKGNSNIYNTEKFSKEKHHEHFTDEFLTTKVTMNKSEIITNLHTAHVAFWNNAFHLPNVNKAVKDKWSVAQNVEHINISLSKVSDYLTLSKSSIESNFGLSQRASISNEQLIKNYLKAIENGAKATSSFIPRVNTETNIQKLIDEGENLLKTCISHLQNWAEDELDKYNCPHPILGQLTAREMLYFTIYHVQHHHKTIQKQTEMDS